MQHRVSLQALHGKENVSLHPRDGMQILNHMIMWAFDGCENDLDSDDRFPLCVAD